METTQIIIAATAVLLTAVFGPLCGAILATGVGMWWQRQREEALQKAHHQAVRFLISLEIDQNLTAFWHFWRRVCETADGIEIDLNAVNTDLSPVQQLHLLKQFVELPLPTWRYQVLESQLPLVPRAFSEEKEKIRQVFDLRTELDTITDIHTIMTNLWSGRPEGAKIIPVIGLSSDNKEVSNQIERLEADMLKSWQTLEPTLKRLWQRHKSLLSQQISSPPPPQSGL